MNQNYESSKIFVDGQEIKGASIIPNSESDNQDIHSYVSEGSFEFNCPIKLKKLKIYKRIKKGKRYKYFYKYREINPISFLLPSKKYQKQLKKFNFEMKSFIRKIEKYKRINGNRSHGKVSCGIDYGKGASTSVYDELHEYKSKE